jgi:hypothetical protein
MISSGRTERAAGQAARAPGFGVEVDAMPGGFVCSAGRRRPSTSARSGGGRRWPSDPLLFTKQQRAFLAEYADGVGIDDLAILGPITVLKLKFAPATMAAARRRAVELPGRLPNPGLGTKCAPSRPSDRGADFLEDAALI